MLEVLFLMSFTLHNIEEGLWLPRWSKYAGKYHPEVSNNEFHFAVIIFTIAGYLLSFLFLFFGHSVEITKYIYLGFVLMMSLNSIFPHLIATIVLRRYAPGTMTGLLLNLPIGSAIIFSNVKSGVQVKMLILALVVVTGISIISLPPLFKLGGKLIDKY